MLRRVRGEGRKALIAASVLALAGVGTGAYFMAGALAAPKPPTPTIVTSPPNPSTSTTAQFTFTDTQSGVTFKCSRDGASFTTCSSGITYTSLSLGNHTFKVEAVSGSNVSDVNTFTWSIVPPTPTILTGPSGSTTATTAKFTFSDSMNGVSFKCSRDGGSYSTCSSGVTYSGLGDGAHTFGVEAIASSVASVPATRTWTVDTTGPTVNVSFPQSLKTYGTGTWNAGCAGGPGICGTATDLTGVASVRVGVLSLNTLRYWNGTSFGSSGQFLLTATGTTSWRLPMPVPPSGTYGVLISATDTLGNVRGVAQVFLFSINTTAPAKPVITQNPPSSTNATTGTFKWTEATSGVTFQCTVDSTTVGCTSPYTTPTLPPGNHCFSVVAVDSLGNSSLPATFCWTITSANTAAAIAMQSGSPQFTTINANFGAPLVAKVTNATSGPVPSVSVTFTAPGSGASGTFASPCSGTTCVVSTDANGLATSPVFKANGTPGSFTVNATVSGVVSPATFSLINSANFTISGDLPSSQTLYPGSSVPLDLTFTNPNPTSITIVGTTLSPALGIVVSTGSTLCLPSPNFTTHGLTTTVTIPGNATRSLSGLGIPQSAWPTLTMVETHTNQNDCRGLHLTLTYSGSAAG